MHTPSLSSAVTAYARANRDAIRKHAPDKIWLDAGYIDENGALHIDGFAETDSIAPGQYFILENLTIPDSQFNLSTTTLETSTESDGGTSASPHNHKVVLDNSLQRPGYQNTQSRVLIAWLQHEESTNSGTIPIVLGRIMRATIPAPS